MKSVFLVLALLIGLLSFSQTEVSGTISGDWPVSGSPYHVVGNINVPSGQTLNIEAGVEVNFQGAYKLLVNGGINAAGTADAMIYFTTDNHAVGWAGIHFNGNSIVSHLTFCRLEYGKASGSEYPNEHGGAVRLTSSNAVFTDCVFADNDATPGEGMGGAVYAINTGSPSGAVTRFVNCTFLRNQAYSEGGAIKFTSDMNTEMIDCQFIQNHTNYGGGAVMFYSVIDTKLINCLVVDNYSNYSNGGALLTLGAGNSIYLTNCTLVGNQASGGNGGALALYYGDATIVNTIAYDNDALYGGTYSDNIYIDAGSGSATVNYSNMIFPEYNTTGSHNIDVDPFFDNPFEGDYHLIDDSPCIDTGIDVGLYYVGEAPDMGCFEYGSTVSAPDVPTAASNVFPNPSKGLVRVTSTEKINNIRISNLLGKELLSITDVNSAEITLDLSYLNSGVYMMRISTDTSTFLTQKIVLEK